MAGLSKLNEQLIENLNLANARKVLPTLFPRVSQALYLAQTPDRLIVTLVIYDRLRKSQVDCGALVSCRLINMFAYGFMYRRHKVNSNHSIKVHSSI